jgi:hypothetical protein
MAKPSGGIVVTRTPRTTRMGTLVRARAIRQGVLKGNRVWLVLGIAVWIMGRLAGSEERATVELKPGEKLLVTHELPRPREGKRVKRETKKRRKRSDAP